LCCAASFFIIPTRTTLFTRTRNITRVTTGKRPVFDEWNHVARHYSLVSGGGSAWAQVMPGGVIEHLRSMSDSTVAHCTFFTNSGIMVANSFLPREWLSAQAQCMSLMAGWVSCEHVRARAREG